MNVFNGGSDPGLAWEELERRVETCAACELHACRKKTVFGQGNRTSPLVFIGEGPGAEEDEQGIAFVGRAVKCRPPENRTPLAKEMMACNEFLEAQLALLRPRIVVCLGNTPVKWLLKTSEGISSLRGRWFPWRGILLFPMFHPSYLLRNDSRKKGSPKDLTWQDINALKDRLSTIRQGGE